MTESRGVGSSNEPHFGRAQAASAPEPQLRARRVDGPEGGQPGPVYVRAGEARAAEAARDVIDTGKSRFGWAKEWGKSAATFGLGFSVLTGVVAAVGHFAGVAVPEASALLFNGAIVAVAYKPIEWGGAKLCSVAKKTVSTAKEKFDDFMKRRAEAAQARTESNVRRTRSAELDDEGPHIDEHPVREPQGPAPNLEGITTEEVVGALKRLIAEDYVRQNPGAQPPDVPREYTKAVAEQLIPHVGSGNPEVDEALRHIRETVQAMRLEQAVSAALAPSAEPPPAAAEPAPAAEEAPAAARPARKPRQRRPKAAAAAAEPREAQRRPPVQGEGVSYEIVDDTPKGGQPGQRPAARA